MHIPSDKQTMLDRVVSLLSTIPGMEGVVLGGSYARGCARPDSDLDIGLYYREDAPFSIDAVRAVAAEISAGDPPDVTGFYGWGPWVNGGAWVHTPVCKVDFIYRNLDQVRRVIQNAVAGRLEHDYLQQPVFGFTSQIYLAETKACLPLFDPHGSLAALKQQVDVYPPTLKARLVNDALWSAEFTLLHANGYASRGDTYTTTGALCRAAYMVTQALFALNETYFMNDKTALAEIDAFPLVPQGFSARLSAILAHTGLAPAELTGSTQAMHGLWSEVAALTGGAYRPSFRV